MITLSANTKSKIFVSDSPEKDMNGKSNSDSLTSVATTPLFTSQKYRCVRAETERPPEGQSHSKEDYQLIAIGFLLKLKHETPLTLSQDWPIDQLEMIVNYRLGTGKPEISLQEELIVHFKEGTYILHGDKWDKNGTVSTDEENKFNEVKSNIEMIKKANNEQNKKNAKKSFSDAITNLKKR